MDRPDRPDETADVVASLDDLRKRVEAAKAEAASRGNGTGRAIPWLASVVVLSLVALIVAILALSSGNDGENDLAAGGGATSTSVELGVGGSDTTQGPATTSAPETTLAPTTEAAPSTTAPPATEPPTTDTPPTTSAAAAAGATTTSEPAPMTTLAPTTTTTEPTTTTTQAPTTTTTEAPTTTTAPSTTTTVAPPPVTTPPAGDDTGTPPSGTPPSGSDQHPNQVVVQSGDSFWSIADSIVSADLGRPATDQEITGFWLQLVDANRSLLVHAGNADLIYPGQTFQVPPSGR